MANTYWVVPGRFAAGEYPGATSRRQAAGRLRTLLRAGIDHFINLTERHEPLEPYAEWGGIGRTGTVVGCWLVRHGMTGDEALAQIVEWWRGMEKARIHPRSPQTREQHAYVRNWAEPSPGRPRE